jgi:two-component system, cell cycle sensor histidine kinase and response regulator CckA
MHEMKRQTQTLQSIIAASPQAIISVDRYRRIQLWNPAATRIFGWTAEEVMGGRVPYVTEDKRDESERFAERALGGESFVNYEVRRVRRDGTPVDLLISTAPTYDDDQLVSGFVNIASDITEYKLLEQQLLRSQRLESLGTLASGIAHDLNNVFAPIAMALQLFRIKFDDRSTQQTLDTLDACVHRGADLVRQILTFARGVQGDRVAIETKRTFSASDTAEIDNSHFSAWSQSLVNMRRRHPASSGHDEFMHQRA